MKRIEITQFDLMQASARNIMYQGKDSLLTELAREKGIDTAKSYDMHHNIDKDVFMFEQEDG